jgi:hypothetical protein
MASWGMGGTMGTGTGHGALRIAGHAAWGGEAQQPRRYLFKSLFYLIARSAMRCAGARLSVFRAALQLNGSSSNRCLCTHNWPQHWGRGETEGGGEEGGGGGLAIAMMRRH